MMQAVSENEHFPKQPDQILARYGKVLHSLQNYRSDFHIVP